MLLLVQPEYPPAVGGMQTHAVASEIVSLWHDTALREQLILNGRKRAHDEFDWDVVITAFEEIFEQAAQPNTVSIYINS